MPPADAMPPIWNPDGSLICLHCGQEPCVCGQDRRKHTPECYKLQEHQDCAVALVAALREEADRLRAQLAEAVSAAQDPSWFYGTKGGRFSWEKDE